MLSGTEEVVNSFPQQTPVYYDAGGRNGDGVDATSCSLLGSAIRVDCRAVVPS